MPGTKGKRGKKHCAACYPRNFHWTTFNNDGRRYQCKSYRRQKWHNRRIDNINEEENKSCITWTHPTPHLIQFLILMQGPTNASKPKINISTKMIARSPPFNIMPMFFVKDIMHSILLKNLCYHAYSKQNKHVTFHCYILPT